MEDPPTVTANDLPLGAFPGFRAETFDALGELVHTKLSAIITKAPKSPRLIDAKGNRLDLPSSTLWACSYGFPLSLKFPEGRHLRVQFKRGGSGATRIGANAIPISETQSCIHAGEAEVDFGENYTQVAWRVPVEALERKLTALTGHSVGRGLQCDPLLDLTTPPSRTTLRILEALLGTVGAGPSASVRLVQAELESALVVSLLGSARHNYSDLLNRGCPSVAPWQVHRVEGFIEENWDKPISLEDMVSAAGASARSVFRAFRQSRDYTPRQFMKSVRLRHAKRLLESDDSTFSVTEVALTCGFSDLGRFSKDFTKAFGEPPSRLLRRTKSQSASND